ncbi:hypothetical protein BH09MYX1_BH09MYX1_06230 [soil metagenome]
MFSHEFDPELGTAIFLFSGTVNTDDDYTRYLAAVADLDRACVGRKDAVALQVIEHGNEVPNAAWRKRIADATAVIQSRPLFVLVTDSAMIRGVLTAINWIRKPTYEFAIAKTFDEAVVLASTFRGSSLDVPLCAMLARLRARL